MEEFFEELIITHHQVTFDQFWDNLILPIISKAYFITIIQRISPIEAYSETLLFAIHNILTNRYLNSHVMILLEVLYLTTVYLFRNMILISCGIIGFILFMSMLSQCVGNDNNPNTIIWKCSVFLVMKYAFAAPDKILNLFWILKVVCDYRFHFQKKSVSDVILFLSICEIFTVVMFFPDVNVYSFLAVLMSYIMIFVWILLKDC